MAALFHFSSEDFCVPPISARFSSWLDWSDTASAVCIFTLPENEPETAGMNLSPFSAEKHTPTVTQNQSPSSFRWTGWRCRNSDVHVSSFLAPLLIVEKRPASPFLRDDAPTFWQALLPAPFS